MGSALSLRSVAVTFLPVLCERFLAKPDGNGRRGLEGREEMAIRYYTAVADPEPGTGLWSIVFPDFPGVTSVAERFADVPLQACDALATAVEDMIAEDEDLPTSSDEGAFAQI